MNNGASLPPISQKEQTMNSLSAETFLSMLIVACVATLVFHQQRGRSILESFDKALEHACILFLVSYGVTASACAHGTWA